jgi:hypothetical protein
VNTTASIVSPCEPQPGAYELEFARRLQALLTERADELAKLGWWARRKRERELRRWVAGELSCLVRAGKLRAKRSNLLRSLLGSEPPVIH